MKYSRHTVYDIIQKKVSKNQYTNLRHKITILLRVKLWIHNLVNKEKKSKDIMRKVKLWCILHVCQNMKDTSEATECIVSVMWTNGCSTELGIAIRNYRWEFENYIPDLTKDGNLCVSLCCCTFGGEIQTSISGRCSLSHSWLSRLC